MWVHGIGIQVLMMCYVTSVTDFLKKLMNPNLLATCQDKFDFDKFIPKTKILFNYYMVGNFYGVQFSYL